MLGPLAKYEERRDAWWKNKAILERRFRMIGNWRLGVGVGAVALGWLVHATDVVSAWWLIAPLTAFLALVVWHARVIRDRTFAARGLRYYDQALDRLKDQWQGKGEAGERFRAADHVYAEDLDLFGKGGLFELACTARTAAGEDALAKWLLHPAPLEDAISRQEATRELSARLDLREDIALLGEDIRSQVRAGAITRWGERPQALFKPALRPLALALSIAALTCAAADLFDLLPNWPLILVLAANAVFLFLTRKRMAGIVATADTPASHLAILALMIERLEREEFAAPLLRQSMDRMRVGGLPAAVQIRRLERLVDMLGWSSHPLMKVVDWLLLWRVQVAFAIEAWRQKSGPHLSEWIQALGEFEALSSLASLAFERPAWTFPQLLPQNEARFEATALRHPLLGEERCVPNDATLNGAPRLMIVSGSNMSGKSTLLRTIGLNTVLAWAGAPVNAAQLKLSALQTGASIRVVDSLQDNRSRFLAEIMRLRQIVDLTRETRPVLFLLDELLSGTNSHDRRIGASGVVKGLLRGNTIGLVTTHDLALTEIASDVGPQAANVHFEDRIVGGQVEFDYRLRPGIVTHSNALELMRAVGLDV
jgi:hypothetical protein